ANTTNGIVVDATGTLQVDVGTLELTGSGKVSLRSEERRVGEANHANTLDNDGNSLVGTGLISNLTLENAALIEALGGTLTLHTGTTISNEAADTREAANAAILDDQDGAIDNANTTNGIVVDATGTLQVDVGTLELTGSGKVSL